MYACGLRITIMDCINIVSYSRFNLRAFTKMSFELIDNKIYITFADDLPTLFKFFYYAYNALSTIVTAGCPVVLRAWNVTGTMVFPVFV